MIPIKLEWVKRDNYWCEVWLCPKHSITYQISEEEGNQFFALAFNGESEITNSLEDAKAWAQGHFEKMCSLIKESIFE